MKLLDKSRRKSRRKSLRKSPRRKASRRKASRRKSPKRKSPKRKTSRRKTSRRKVSRRKSTRRKASRRKDDNSENENSDDSSYQKRHSKLSPDEWEAIFGKSPRSKSPRSKSPARKRSKTSRKSPRRKSPVRKRSKTSRKASRKSPPKIDKLSNKPSLTHSLYHKQFRVIMPKSNRAKCKECNGPVLKDHPKMERLILNPFIGDTEWKSFHIDCLFKNFLRNRCSTHVIQSKHDYDIDHSNGNIPQDVIDEINKLAEESNRLRQHKCKNKIWNEEIRAYE